MKKYLKSLVSAAACAGALAFAGDAHAATFPAATDWHAVTQGNVGLGDPSNDGSTNAREIVGDDNNSALYIATNATHFFIRVRLDSDPQSTPGDLGPFGWGILIDSDGNYGKYDFSLMVSGKNNEDNIQYWRNDAPTTGGDPSDPADVMLQQYPNVFSGVNQNVRVVPAPTTFNGNADVFLDIAIPLADFYGAGNANFTPTTPLTFWVGASSNANNIQTDLGETDSPPGPDTLGPSASDPFYTNGTRACTTDANCGGATSGMICSGTPLACVAGCRGTGGNGCPTGFTCSSTTSAAGTCQINDTDGDGVPNAVETTLGSLPNDADSDDDTIPDNVELSASGSSGPFTAIDTDGDGSIDALDTDSDNDCVGDQTDANRRNAAVPNASADANCGNATSGVICSGSPVACVSGCRGTGNGCPVGFTCSSTTSAPGTCSPTDTDGDGVPDSVEVALGTLPNDTDSDNDTILDNVELSASGSTGPYTAIDTDDDGTIDARDTDSDNDCVGDQTDTDRRNAAVPNASANANCGGGTPVCDTTAGVCRPLCSTDANCGGATSGLVCTGSPTACVAGCRGTGGNGCPTGFTCSSTNNTVGTCSKTDTDGDGVADVDETAFGTNPAVADTDGDGLSDGVELSLSGSSGPYSALDSDGDGKIDAKDADSDNDGIPDAIEKGALATGTDSDGDTIADFRDLDADNDGIPDLWENGAASADANDDGRVDATTDADGDGLVATYDSDDTNASVKTAKTAVLNTDGDADPDYLDLDSDGDTVKDIVEAGGTDANDDGRVDAFVDADKDGFAKVFDPTEAGTPLAHPDTDGDAAPNSRDSDDDGDSLLTQDELGTGGATSPRNTDATDGPDYLDPDDDNDGIVTKDEVDDSKLAAVGSDDVDGDGKVNWLDDDADADGVTDGTDGRADTNNNGKPEYLDPKDTDGDGIADPIETSIGSDPNNPDTDGDGLKDGEEVGTGGTPRDTDGDGKIDAVDDDDDGDGILTKDERSDASGAGLSDDVDNDGKKNWLDSDADGDGLSDGTETRNDTDKDGKPEYLDPASSITPSGPGPTTPTSPAPTPDNEAGLLEGGGFACAVSRAGDGSAAGFALAMLAVASLLRRRRR